MGEKKFGQGKVDPQKQRGMNEKITDGARGMFEKATVSFVPLKLIVHVLGTIERQDGEKILWFGGLNKGKRGERLKANRGVNAQGKKVPDKFSN